MLLCSFFGPLNANAKILAIRQTVLFASAHKTMTRRRTTERTKMMLLMMMVMVMVVMVRLLTMLTMMTTRSTRTMMMLRMRTMLMTIVL